jgi:Na+/proline symporter
MVNPQGEGSLAIGIVLGFFVPCFLGLIGAFIWGKPQTKKGAVIGCVAGVVIGIIFNVAMRA